LAILVAGFAMFRTSRVQGASSKPHVAVTPKPLPVVSALQSTLGANPSVNIVEPELQIVPVKTVPVGREHSRTNSQEKPAPVADVIVKPNTLERKHDKPFGVNPPNEKPVVLTHKQPGQHEEKSAPTPKEDKPVVVYAAPRKEPSPFDAYLGNSHPARQEITPAAPLDEDSSPSQRRRSRTARTDDTPRDDNRYYLERGLDERRTRSERRVTVRVCVDSGEIAGRGCPHTALLNVPASDAPNRACRLHHAR
jgi:hypothetical protein